MLKTILLLFLLLLPAWSFPQVLLTNAEVAEIEALLLSNQHELNELMSIQQAQSELLSGQKTQLESLQDTLNQAWEQLTNSQAELSRTRDSLLTVQTELQELRNEMTELLRLYEQRDKEAKRWKWTSFGSWGLLLLLFLL